MLRITVPEGELFDYKKQEFLQTKEAELVLEHSLISISKWESKWNKPYLSTEGKTAEERVDYIRCMTVNSGVDHNVYYALTEQNLIDIAEYLAEPMTATKFNDIGGSSGGVMRAYTSEEIYALMVMYNIPFSCQKWHINRLLTLIRVCDVKSQPEKKIPRDELMRRNADLNAQRRAQMKSKG